MNYVRASPSNDKKRFVKGPLGNWRCKRPLTGCDVPKHHTVLSSTGGHRTRPHVSSVDSRTTSTLKLKY